MSDCVWRGIYNRRVQWVSGLDGSELSGIKETFSSKKKLPSPPSFAGRSFVAPPSSTWRVTCQYNATSVVQIDAQERYRQ